MFVLFPACYSLPACAFIFTSTRSNYIPHTRKDKDINCEKKFDKFDFIKLNTPRFEITVRTIKDTNFRLGENIHKLHKTGLVLRLYTDTHGSQIPCGIAAPKQPLFE